MHNLKIAKRVGIFGSLFIAALSPACGDGSAGGGGTSNGGSAGSSASGGKSTSGGSTASGGEVTTSGGALSLGGLTGDPQAEGGAAGGPEPMGQGGEVDQAGSGGLEPEAGAPSNPSTGGAGPTEKNSTVLAFIGQWGDAPRGVYALSIDDLDAEPTALSAALPEGFAAERLQASPDGERLSFVARSADKGVSEVWTVRADGSELTRVSEFTGLKITFTQWSPDSSYLIYDLIGEDFAELFVANADGSSSRRLATAALTFDEVQWSANSEYVAYIERGKPYAFVVKRSAGTPRPLTAELAETRAPAVHLSGFSQDGRWLSIYYKDSTAEGTLRAAAFSTAELTPFPLGKLDFADRPPRWSPTLPTLVGRFENTFQLSDLAVPRKQVMQPLAADYAWSPNGDRLAVIAGESARLDVVDFEGAAPKVGRTVSQALVVNGKVERAAWSADGQSLFYSASAEVANRYELFVVGADGQGRRKLSIPAVDNSGVAAIHVPPQGNAVAYTASHLSAIKNELFVTNLAGTQNLSVGAFDATPAWSKDGGYLCGRVDSLLQLVNVRTFEWMTLDWYTTLKQFKLSKDAPTFATIRR